MSNRRLFEALWAKEKPEEPHVATDRSRGPSEGHGEQDPSPLRGTLGSSLRSPVSHSEREYSLTEVLSLWVWDDNAHSSPPSLFLVLAQKMKSDTVSTVSPFISHEVMGPDAMIFVF